MVVNRHIVVCSTTYNALRSLLKYRETMDDIVLRAVIAYTKERGLTNEQITCAISEFNRRFGEDIKEGE